MSAVEAPALPQPAIRDQLADHLLTPQNAALIVIDYQPSQFAAIRSIDQELLTKNIRSTVKVALLFGLPIVHSTVIVSTGLQEPTVQPLAELLNGYPPIDRTTINAWEDPNLVAAVRATGRRKLVMAALWTEMCLAFPTLDALREGFEVYPVTDAQPWSASSRPVRSRSRGSRSPASWSATELDRKRSRASLKRCSTSGSSRSEPDANPTN
jgi:isochorismate hydrolase